MINVARKHGYTFALGNVYPHDAQIRISKINELYLCARTRNGSVLIVHDRPWTVPVLHNALAKLSKSFKFVSLNELRDLKVEK